MHQMKETAQRQDPILPTIPPHQLIRWQQAIAIAPEADPVEKISIMPRGQSLGATQQLPQERYNYTEAYMRTRLRVMLAGRAAEAVMLGTVSTGAADDLSQATRLAHRMVGQWGMGASFRNLAFEPQDEQQVFLGEQIGRQRSYSEETARDIDLEVKELVETAYAEAEETLREGQDRLERLAEALEENEVLAGEPLQELLGAREGQAPSPDERHGASDPGEVTVHGVGPPAKA
jgi:cell division protease FtsH